MSDTPPWSEESFPRRAPDVEEREQACQCVCNMCVDPVTCVCERRVECVTCARDERVRRRVNYRCEVSVDVDMWMCSYV